MIGTIRCQYDKGGFSNLGLTYTLNTIKKADKEIFNVLSDYSPKYGIIYTIIFEEFRSEYQINCWKLLDDYE